MSGARVRVAIPFRYHPRGSRPRFRHGDDHHEQNDHSDGGESQEGRVVAKCPRTMQPAAPKPQPPIPTFVHGRLFQFEI